jgi:dGTP triphosphohydrolase
MKKLLDHLKQTVEMLNEEIEKRETVFDERSEKWQESEKGEKYQEITGYLEELRDDMDYKIETIEDEL